MNEQLTINIEVNGTLLAQEINILEVYCESALEERPTAQVQFVLNKEEIANTAATGYPKVGDRIKIMVGYSGETKPLYSGKVTSETIKVDQAAGMIYLVDCESKKYEDESQDAPVLSYQLGESIFSMDLSRTKSGKSILNHGFVVFQGNADALPGTQLTIEGVGGHFGGIMMINAVEHKIVEGNWETSVLVVN